MKMGNILEFIRWRGDLTFAQSPFCEVDALILSAVSYVELDRIVSENPAQQMRLKDAFEEFRGYLQDPKYHNVGRIIPDEVLVLFEEMADSTRYASLQMSGYVNHVDELSEEQFAAVTFQNENGDIYIVYRGTDDTIVGWKEDFNIAYMDVIPAQEAAVNYLSDVAAALKGTIRLMGHSKGGNLAIYSAARCGKRLQKKISGVYNMDGPGFLPEFLSLDVYQAVNEKTYWYLPYESMIGTLLCHGTNEFVVRSTNRGIMQHDPFSWEIMGNHFIRERGLSKEALIVHLAIDECMKKLTIAQRKQFVSIIFDALAATEAKTLSEISPKSIVGIIDSVKNIDPESKKLLSDMLKLVLKTVRENR
jgi:hypothetical protein